MLRLGKAFSRRTQDHDEATQCGLELQFAGRTFRLFLLDLLASNLSGDALTLVPKMIPLRTSEAAVSTTLPLTPATMGTEESVAFSARFLALESEQDPSPASERRAARQGLRH